MLKLTTRTLAALALLTAPALADQTWNITEEGLEGIKAAQGKWFLKIEGDKLSGEANLNKNAGEPLNYKIEGAKTADGYEIKLLDRTDGKNNCVWAAKTPASKIGLTGKVSCDGKPAFIIRAGF
jgi:hypothetical protein